MKKILWIFMLLFCAKFLSAQPFVLPTRSSSALTVQDARWRALLTMYAPRTHGLTLNGGLDTVGAIIYEDSSRHFWYRDTVVSGGHKWTMVLTQPDVAITNLIQQGANITITGSGTLASPYIISSSGGGGGGGIDTVKFTAQNGFTGVWASPGGPNASLSIGTSVNGLLVGNGTGMGAAIIGAGLSFVGTTLSNTITNNNQLANGNNFISNVTNFIAQGTNITITGAGTLVSPYVINSSGGGGGLNGAGNLAPLFTTSVSGTTLLFAASNATANTLYGNFTGSPAAPTFGTPSLTSAMFANQGTTTTLLIGNGAGNLSFGSVNLSTMVTNVLAAANGGTGQSSYTIGDILYASSSSVLSKLAAAAVGNVLLANGIGAPPIYGKVNLTSMVTGILPVVNGGSGSSSPSLVNGVFTIVGGSWPNQHIDLDTAHLHDTTFVKYLGVTGDTLIRASNDTLYSPRIRDSLVFHHVVNGDGSITMYVAGAGGTNVNIGSGFRWAVPGTNNIKTFFCIGCTLDSTTNSNANTLTVNKLILTRVNINSGTSSTLSGGNVLVQFDFASVAATYTLTTPVSPSDQDIVEIQTGKTIAAPGTEITNFTLSPNGAQSFNFAVGISTLGSGESIKIRYNSSGNFWDRLR